MFELYFPKSPRDWASILCFLLDQKVSSLLLFVFSLELSQRVREIRKTWTNTNLEVTNILTLTTVAMILTSHASVRSDVLVSGDMMWDWDLVIGLWLLTAATAQESHLLCGWAWLSADPWRPSSQEAHNGNVCVARKCNSHPALALVRSRVITPVTSCHASHQRVIRSAG